MGTIFDRVSAMPADKRDALTQQFDKASRIAAAEPVAVLGIGCRFPGGAVGPEGYWNFLANSGDGISEIPSDRWNADEYYDPDQFAPGRMSSKWGGFLPDVAGFDADFFGISPREAEAMDPQQRLMLEVAFEALEHAGIAPEQLAGIRAAVMMGVYYTEYQTISAANPDNIDAYSATGNAHAVAVGRIAYLLGLRGPAVAIDSACSSSLVTIHLACQSLRLRESDLALAGGVSLILRPETQIAMSKWGMLSPQGRCHTFDSRADGFVRGEGAGIVVLKRLTDAVRDGDRVLAVVRGSAVNQDGRSNGLTAPNTIAQSDVITRALRSADVTPGSVNFIEAHGTGTALGDPIEFEALADVYGRGDGPCALGAVKTNIGHLEAAAGIAGFIKAALSVQRGQIPPNLHFSQWNPAIDPSPTRLFVPTELSPWPADEGPRRAAVSSFGLGGTNAHVVIEQGPEPAPVSDPDSSSPVTTLMVSGKTDQRIASWAAALADWMDRDGAGVPLADIAHTVNHYRSRHNRFATVSARDRGQAVTGLRAVAAGQPTPGVVGPREAPRGSGTVFLYSGQGSQWAGMGRQLLADEPAFAAAVDELEAAFVEQAGFSLRDLLVAGEPVVGIERIQPVLVGMQLALTALWRSYDVEPDAVIGHSMGEVTAAVVAGALSPADGLKVIATRSRLMSRLSGQGAMALLELDPESAEALIVDYPQLTLAVYASPRQSVIAGPPDQVDAVIAVVAAQDRLARRIEVDVASHHPIIDPVLPELRTALAALKPRRPGIPVITTTDDHAGSGATLFDVDYWAANLRNPVRFSQAVATAGADYGTFVEVSPHPVLTHAISDTLDDAHHHSIGTLERDTHDTLTFHAHLNATHNVRPPKADHPSGPHPVIPTTPWHHTRHWLPTKERVDSAGSAPKYGTLLGAQIAVATTPPTCLWQARLLPEAKPYPGCHRIHGVEVVPVSVLLQTFSAAASECGASALSAIRFEYPIVVDQPRVIQVLADGESITVSSRPMTGTIPYHWVRHATGRLTRSGVDPQGAEDGATHDDQHENAGDEMSAAADLLESWGIEGQPFSWSVEALRAIPGGLIAHVCSTEESTVALLDAAVHVARLVNHANPRLMVPAEVESIWLSAAPGDGRGRVEIRRVAGNTDEIVVDIVVKTLDGTACVDIRSLRYADVDSDIAQSPDRRADPRSFAHAIQWRPWSEEPDGPASATGTLAVVGAGSAASAELQTQLNQAGYLPAGITEARYVVYLAEPRPAEDDIDCAARLSSEVTDLVRQLVGRDEHHPATLWILTRGVREAVSSAALPQSSLWGLAAVIGAEHPELWGGLIDIPAEDDLVDCVAALSRVLPTAAKGILSLRADEFLAPAMVPISGQPVREPLRCRPDAAYLIVGGMGALGVLMADWLADRGARRLILAGRSSLPPRRDWDSTTDPDLQNKIAAIRALEGRGISIDAVAFDVGSPDAVQTLLATRDRDGSPPIRGVIHAAGVTESALLTDTTDDSLRRVMWPKIAGAQALHSAFPPGRLDFFFLTASAGTVFGVPGQAAYAAANAYLDCLARARSRHGCHTVSLDWVAWQGLGFGADAAVTVQELARLGSRPVSAEEAFAAWDYVDRYDIAQAVMAPMPSAESNGESAFVSVPAWSELAGEDLPRKLEDELRAILARELRLTDSELESDRPFAELGLNSVMAMSIRREVEQLAGIELSVTMLWNHPTIASLTAFLAKKLSPQEVSSDDDGDENGLPASSSPVLDALFESVESAQ
jgi:phthiocerol/phenolphthiocerol synthesis type-I polyketide synthase A